MTPKRGQLLNFLRAASGSAVCILLLSGCTGTSQQAVVSPTAFSVSESSSPNLVALVQQRDFSIRFRLDGVTAASDLVPIALIPGLVWESPVGAGTMVTAGSVIGTTIVDLDVRDQLALQSNSSRIAAAQLRDLVGASGTVLSPVAGTISSQDGQVGVVDAGTDVVVTVTPIQWLRLRFEQLAGQATVETVVGQRTVPCTAMWFVETPSDSADSVVTLHCRLSSTVETVPGLRAGVQVATLPVKNATVVPNSMIGTDASGYVVTIRDGDGTRTVPIDVGASDGVVRVVTSSLPVGAELVAPTTSP